MLEKRQIFGNQQISVRVRAVSTDQVFHENPRFL